MGIIAKIAAGLRKTKDNFLGRLKRIFNSFTKIDEELFEELEEAMIMSDIGVETSEEICDRLRKTIKERGITDPNEIMDLIQEIIADMMGDDTGLDLTNTPAVIMVIGVNGAGKTTTIGKLCYQFKNEGKKVLVAAADTFRAAAIDQLEVWTQRAGVDIVKHAEGSDPGAVVYDALEAARARECDVVIIDTAGRLHNKKNLMEELAKINRIIDKKSEECSREVLLVLDATTGQNAVNQAKLFSETAPITGIVLTKLDGTAKGGIVISIKNELGIPVKLIGVGEKIDDLQPFDSHTFVEALFSDTDLDDVSEERTDEAGEAEEPDLDDYDSDIDEEDADEEADVQAAEAAVYEYYGQSAPEEEDEEPAVMNADDEDTTEPENASFTAVSEDEDAEEEKSEEEPGEEYTDGLSSDSEETDEDEEEEEAVPAEPEKKKKRGFFSRLFGRKKYEEETEESEEDDDDSDEELSDDEEDSDE